MKPPAKWIHKVLAWATGRKFLYLSSFPILENRPPCDACGSKRVKNFCLLEHENNHYLIGCDCFRVLYNNGLIVMDARITWKDTPYWRDVEAIVQKVVAVKQARI
jgi:hypothetical protein